MPLQIVQKSIAEMCCDAIVDPTDSSYSGSGGADRAIHAAGGFPLELFCSGLAPLKPGKTAVSPGFGLPCKRIIHIIGPVWQGGDHNEEELLRDCYINAIVTAKMLCARSVAFPLISSGRFGFPKDLVLSIAVDTISKYMMADDPDREFYICIPDRNAFVVTKEDVLNKYLDDRRSELEDMTELACCSCESLPPRSAASPKAMRATKEELSDWLKKQDDSFAVTLLKLIDKKGMSDVECYKKANVTRKTFWKINNSASYKPSKQTVLAFAVALELNMDETEQLLRSAGFSLSHNNTFDLIVEFYITNGIYDIFEINSALYRYDQLCLGC